MIHLCASLLFALLPVPPAPPTTLAPPTRLVPPTTLLPLRVSEMARDTEAIVVATVAGSDCRFARGRDTIRTYVALRDVVVYRGNAPTDLVLELEGGDIGDHHLLVPGMPKLEVGKTYLMCISGNGRRPSPIVGFSQGVFEIGRGRNGTVLKTLRGLELIGVKDDRLVLAGTAAAPAGKAATPDDGTPLVVPPAQDDGTRAGVRDFVAALWSAR